MSDMPVLGSRLFGVLVQRAWKPPPALAFSFTDGVSEVQRVCGTSLSLSGLGTVLPASESRKDRE